MEDRKPNSRSCGSRRNYLRPGIEKRECGYAMPTESMQYNAYMDGCGVKKYSQNACGCTKDSTEMNFACSPCPTNAVDGCNPESICPELPLAAAYVPMQPFTGLVNPDEALARGSSFENLYIPYSKGGCM